MGWGGGAPSTESTPKAPVGTTPDALEVAIYVVATTPRGAIPEREPKSLKEAMKDET